MERVDVEARILVSDELLALMMLELVGTGELEFGYVLSEVPPGRVMMMLQLDMLEVGLLETIMVDWVDAVTGWVTARVFLDEAGFI